MESDLFSLFYRFGVSLFIGVLIGLQREYASEVHDASEIRSETFAGVRTFALMSLVGCTAALLTELLGSAWVFVAIIVPLGALITAGYFITSWHGDTGMTTEVAALATVLVGALCYWDQLVLAVALGVTITVLLSLKLELHQFAARLTRDDILAALQFAVITAVVLPLLPDETFGPAPFDIFNPYHIWLFVVLISGISFLGYVLMKATNVKQGIPLTGLLGGLASSTATTLSFAERSHKNKHFARSFALAIVLAWTTMFGRILVEIGTVNSNLLRIASLPLVVTGVSGLLYCAYLYFSAPPEDDEEEVSLANPFDLGPAIKFGLIYTTVLIISRGGQYYFGDTGLYVSSIVAGLADVDAIALSVAELSTQTGGPALPTAARAVVMAAVANTFAKAALVAATGSAPLRRALLPGALLMLATGAGTLFLI